MARSKPVKGKITRRKRPAPKPAPKRRRVQKTAESPSPVATALGTLKFDRNGLIPAIAQQFDTGEVLMFAWMNREAIEQSLRTGLVAYWSRSRRKLWRKGETSGQIQQLVELRIDCDQDALLLQVDQKGVACHTGRRSCFFTALRGGEIAEIIEVTVDPRELYGERR